MKIPALGFGTAPMLGRESRRRSLAALHYAYERGVRHFDTARSYGWGEAETLLGRFLPQYPRESYVIVSKCGIIPVKPSPVINAIKTTGRIVVNAFPSKRKLVQRVASAPAFAPSLTHDVGALRQSFETSLQELRCGWLDVLLLHNFCPTAEGLPEIVAWMSDLKRQKKIREFGFCVEAELVAGLTMLEKTGVLSECIVQSPVSRELLQLPQKWRHVRFIAHSPFHFPGKRLEDILVELTQQCHCQAVVCSMFTPAHIDQNVRARNSLLERISDI